MRARGVSGAASQPLQRAVQRGALDHDGSGFRNVQRKEFTYASAWEASGTKGTRGHLFRIGFVDGCIAEDHHIGARTEGRKERLHVVFNIREHGWLKKRGGVEGQPKGSISVRRVADDVGILPGNHLIAPPSQRAARIA